jgi:hypothetical protein
MTDAMNLATRLMRTIAAIAAVAFAWTAISFFIPQRWVTSVGVTAAFAGAVALALAPLLTVLVVTWRAKELPDGLRRTARRQAILLAVIGALLFWADAGHAISMTVAITMIAMSVVGLVRTHGTVHTWVDDAIGAPNVQRAARVGVLAMLLALSHSIAAKFQGVDSERIELSVLRAELRNIESAQLTFHRDSGRFATSIESLALQHQLPDSLVMASIDDRVELTAVGRYGGTCSLTVDPTSTPDDGDGAFPDCELGALENKPLIPEVPLYLLGALLCGWLLYRPLAPHPRPAS